MQDDGIESQEETSAYLRLILPVLDKLEEKELEFRQRNIEILEECYKKLLLKAEECKNFLGSFLESAVQPNKDSLTDFNEMFNALNMCREYEVSQTNKLPPYKYYFKLRDYEKDFFKKEDLARESQKGTKEWENYDKSAIEYSRFFAEQFAPLVHDRNDNPAYEALGIRKITPQAYIEEVHTSVGTLREMVKKIAESPDEVELYQEFLKTLNKGFPATQLDTRNLISFPYVTPQTEDRFRVIRYLGIYIADCTVDLGCQEHKKTLQNYAKIPVDPGVQLYSESGDQLSDTVRLVRSTPTREGELDYLYAQEISAILEKYKPERPSYHSTSEVNTTSQQRLGLR